MTTGTVLETLVNGARRKVSSPDGKVPPAAVLWPDPKCEWYSVVPSLLQGEMPELLTLGDYNPDARTGPAIWLRCVVDGALSLPEMPAEATPILYLPRISLSDLRDPARCPAKARPLVELCYRGILWINPKGREWTIFSFLSSSEGPKLKIRNDSATKAALKVALTEVVQRPVEDLLKRQLDDADFYKMVLHDLDSNVLRWIGDSRGTRSQLEDGGQWDAFRKRCQDELDFDPEQQAGLDLARKLGEGEGRWKDIWARFADAPQNYIKVVQVLENSRPPDMFPFHRERWPYLNEEAENEAQTALEDTLQLPHPKTCDAVCELDEKHKERRQWLWAELDMSPLAQVLGHLATVARVAKSPLGGATADDIASAYVDGAWEADAAARLAMAKVKEHEKLIANVLKHLLEPWLGSSAHALQKVIVKTLLSGASDRKVAKAKDGECIVFVDGLRYELGRSLAKLLEQKGCRVSIERKWAALPTVTATAKPAATPVAEQVKGGALGPDFLPEMSDGSGSADTKRIRKAMQKNGYKVLNGGGDLPPEEPARGWLETGNIDHFGHDHRAVTFARLADEELEKTAQRILELFKVGWSSVKVVTDHGWLWLPGGLPMVKLPKHLTEAKWARCAVISGDSKPDVPRFPWHWNPAEWFAVPPGAACFSKKPEYSHGGVSVQECVIPELRVEQLTQLPVSRCKIQKVEWRGMRLTAELEVVGGPMTADIRLEHTGGKSVVQTVRKVPRDGYVSLLLAGDEHEDAELVFVVSDESCELLLSHPTRTGEDR